jgi:hypothetical protein
MRLLKPFILSLALRMMAGYVPRIKEGMAWYSSDLQAAVEAGNYKAISAYFELVSCCKIAAM